MKRMIIGLGFIVIASCADPSSSHEWRRVQSNVTANLAAVAASSPSRAWAVGERGTTLRWSGARWEPMAGHFSLNYRRVRTTSDGNAWAFTGLEVYRFSEGRWNAVPPQVGVGSGSLKDVLPFDAASAVGITSPTLTPDASLWDWDGTSWSALGDSSFPRFASLWGTARDDLWLAEIGRFSLWSPEAARVFHYDGVHLIDVTPSDRPHGLEWRAVTGASDGTAWLVGKDDITPLFYRRVGEGWERVGDVPAGVETLWPASADEAYAVGLHGQIFRFAGGQWSVSLPRDDSAVNLLGIGGSGPSDVWAVGESGVILRLIRPDAR
jgi:hypothetical protein